MTDDRKLHFTASGSLAKSLEIEAGLAGLSLDDYIRYAVERREAVSEIMQALGGQENYAFLRLMAGALQDVNGVMAERGGDWRIDPTTFALARKAVRLVLEAFAPVGEALYFASTPWWGNDPRRDLVERIERRLAHISRARIEAAVREAGE